ncbi:hypothetical protein TRV_01086 [Trichophyton verrucosum HKI 0517]|uniref:Uncharacterized protein n=1 Tax=Trichophyton verrucosum (strain HKI 0517) TaxID=663202 RepID=D4D1Y4_TRIVH|nr:uncharacterized protein TRV_01086 [Trichophyton verrucosum HKI 0517]EFE44126.1 hypothetical protein TRV_01086 [Trichophyton verrucosum HKI 0517]
MSSFQSELDIAPSVEERSVIIHQSRLHWEFLREMTVDEPLSYVPDICQRLENVPDYTHSRHAEYIDPSNQYVFGKGVAKWSTTDTWGCEAPHSLEESECNSSHSEDFMRLAENKMVVQDVFLGVRDALPCYLDESHGLRGWIGNGDGRDYVAVLTLAWAYILSSAWATSQNGKIRYTAAGAPTCASGQAYGPALEICTENPEVVRWWSAVLAPGQGWVASIRLGGDVEYQSPWAIHLISYLNLTMCGPAPVTPIECPNAPTSYQYLRHFCLQYGLVEQAKAALVAALMIPTHAHTWTTFVLPAPKLTHSNPPTVSSGSQCEVLDELICRIPHLMTISSACTVLDSLLCSVFFEPSVPCNLCSDWLEPIFPILDSVDLRRATTMCMFQGASVQGWWLGSAITGLDRFVLRETRRGTPYVNLQSWWWTQTPQSFICFAYSDPIGSSETLITREKETFLLFLSQKNWINTPPPWKPPGRIVISDSHLAVQQHARCTGHSLRYMSWCWVTKKGEYLADAGYTSPGDKLPPVNLGSLARLEWSEPDVDIAPETMDQYASKICSDTIFGCIWKEGVAVHDRDLHESLGRWLYGDPIPPSSTQENDPMLDSDDLDGIVSTNVADIEAWLDLIVETAPGIMTLRESYYL